MAAYEVPEPSPELLSYTNQPLRSGRYLYNLSTPPYDVYNEDSHINAFKRIYSILNDPSLNPQTQEERADTFMSSIIDILNIGSFNFEDKFDALKVYFDPNHNHNFFFESLLSEKGYFPKAPKKGGSRRRRSKRNRKSRRK